MTLENAIMRHASGNLAPLLSALLLFLASPWIGFTGLAWIALAPILLYVTLAPLTISRVVAVLFSLFAYALSIAYPYMHVEGAWWAGVNGLSGLLTENAQYTSVMLFAAFIRALFFLPVVLLWRMALPRAYGPLLLSLLFAWAEWVFGALFLTGYSAGVIGYVLVDTPYLADLASLPTGVFTLSALVVYGNAFLAQALTRRRAQQGRWSSPRQVGEALMFLAIVAASFCYGLAYEHSKRWTEPPLTVAVIGTPLSTEETITESGYRSYRKELIAALAVSPDLVLFPENAFPYFELDEEEGTLRSNTLVNFADRDALYGDLRAISLSHPSTTLAIGMHTHREGKRFNSLVFMKSGVPRSYYHKRSLVPFTEYAPLGLSLSLAVRFSEGERHQSLSIDGRSVEALICSEVGDFSQNDERARLLLIPSNDSVFEGTAAAKMHQIMARARAIENDAYVARADKGGTTSVIDPYGRVATSTNGGFVTATLFR